MTNKHTPPPGNPLLPDTIYTNALTAAGIEPNAELMRLLKKLHQEELTSGIFTASLKECAKPPSKKSNTSPSRGGYPEEYTNALKSAGLIPNPRLLGVVERRHMERLNINLAVKAYIEFRNRFPQGCDSKQEGEQS